MSDSATQQTPPARQLSTLMLLRSPVRMLERHGDTWLVVPDLCAAVGIDTKLKREWKEIPEMERDVDWFKSSTGKDEMLRIVSVAGLPFLLRNAPIMLASKVLQWAQISLCTDAA